MNSGLNQHGEGSSLGNRQQLTLAGLFSITTAVALVLGYAARLGQDSMQLVLIYCGWVLASGFVVGFSRRDWKNAFFWGGLFSLLAFLAVAGARIPHPSVAVGWGAVGAVIGSCVGVRLPKNFVTAVVLNCFLGWITMSCVVFCMGQELTGHVGFDTLCAGIVGGLLKPFTSVLQWIEKESHHPRFLLASWLAISVLIGNTLVPIMVGVQR